MAETPASSNTTQSEMSTFPSDLPYAKPTKFAGHVNPELVNTFLSEIENVCSIRISDKSKWVSYARQFMTGRASDWFKVWNPCGETRTWEEFVRDLKHNFYPPNYSAMVCNAFERIKCTTGILDYNIKFAKLMSELPEGFRNNEYLTFRYTQGLPKPVLMYVRQQPDQNLDSLMRAAQIWDQDIAISDQNYASAYIKHLADTSYSSLGSSPNGSPAAVPPNLDYSRNAGYSSAFPVNRDQRRAAPPRYSTGRGNSNGRGPSYNRASSNYQHAPRYQTPNTRSNFMANQNQSHNQASSGPTNGPEPMDLSEVQLRPLTDRERDYLQSKGLCYNCGRGRHYARNCPYQQFDRRSKNGPGQH